ncbi:fibrinogen alpha chain [Chanos chanos]|uniref:Fibrinogen alpha chain n=1 Tax=Chanos chanos TaxID=29144 RepID=A0A6J2VKP9_CHACN|nr:fibrinogen alpha chain-like [Chanos chanos]
MGKLRGTDQYSTQTRKMKLQQVFLCLCAVIATVWSEEATALNPRGTRPVEHGYKPDKCASEKQWPFCIDDQWGKKCPSGCRIQGLLDKADHELQSRIEKLRHILGQGQGDYRTANQQSKQTYSYLREQLNLGAGQDSSYLSVADQLRQRITEMKIKIDRQLKLLDALKNEVKKQVIAMQRLEVDIDIKLRSCKGSCSSYQAFSVDKDSFAALDKQLDHLDSLAVQSVETVSSLRVMKSRPLKEELVSSVYKSGLTGGERAEQKLDLFGDVKQVEFSLEAEGSTAESAATVSKVTLGTGSATSPSTTTHVSTHTVSCTKTVRKITEMTKDGPVERQRIEYSGGPGCDRLKTLSVDDHTLLAAAKEGKDLSVGGYNVRVTSSSTDGTDETKSITTLSRGDSGFDGLGGFHDDFFKDLGGSSSKMSTSSSSSSSTFSSHSSKSSGSSKGTLSDSKTTFFGGPLLGDDLGGFLRGEVEEDLPDIHARSVKTSRTERRSGYVGGDCVDILQKHTSGGQSGLFRIKPAGSEEVVEVFCDQVTGLGGWTLFQQREDGSVNFNRTWDDFRKGFGRIDQKGRGEVWLGNRLLHLLTQRESLLRVEVQDWEGKEAYAEYNIKVGSEAAGFPLSVSGYIGDAGDALVQGQPNLGFFLSHNGMKFSTFDRDNDKWEENCAEMYGGGWWYNNCQSANLNGIYYKGGQYDPGSKSPYEIENGVVWLPFKPADYSLKVVRMKIRPV